MDIVHQSPTNSFISPPVPILFLPAPPKRLALPAPKIAGYLPAPKPVTALTTMTAAPKKRVVEAEIANPLLLIDIRRDFDAWWAEFERIHGRVKTIEEMDAEIEAKHPGYLAWVARRKARKAYAEVIGS